MAQIGNWGSAISFSVNANKQLTFKSFTRETGSRWSTHEIVNSKSKSEFVGAELDAISYEVVLSAEYGVNPKKVIDKLRTAISKGEVNYLFIGGKKVGKNKFYLESMSESWDTVYSQGELVKATLSLNFKEYV